MNSASVTNALIKYKEQLEKLVEAPVTFKVTPDSTHSYIHATILTGAQTVAAFGLIRMPGNCGMVIATAISVYLPYQGKGIGKLLAEIREEASLADGYTLLLETGTIKDNERELKLLTKQGYHEIERFVNNRTKNTIWVMAKNLRGG